MSRIWSLQVTHLLGCVGIEAKKLSNRRWREKEKKAEDFNASMDLTSISADVGGF
jgi:glycine cleavage system regulatory protein